MNKQTNKKGNIYLSDTETNIDDSIRTKIKQYI